MVRAIADRLQDKMKQLLQVVIILQNFQLAIVHVGRDVKGALPIPALRRHHNITQPLQPIQGRRHHLDVLAVARAAVYVSTLTKYF